MKKLYFSLLSLMIISVVGFAQVSKPLVSHAKQADASKLYITGSQSMKDGEITTCPANSLFSSTYDAPSSAGLSEVNANYHYQIATSFQTVGGTIETVHIWMLSVIFENLGGWNFCDGDPMHVNVTFYENNAGAVGDVYATFTDITPTITPANLTLFGSYPVSFMSITLPSSVDLANGFVSVQGTTPSAGTDCWLMWVNAPNGGGTAYQSTDGVWGASGIGYAVCLEGTPAASTNLYNISNINIYPNPSNGLVTITNAEGSSIEVINVTGQVVARFNANSNVTTFDAGFLRDGNYFVRIMDGSKITIKILHIKF